MPRSFRAFLQPLRTSRPSWLPSGSLASPMHIDSGPSFTVIPTSLSSWPVPRDVSDYSGEARTVFCRTSTATTVSATLGPLPEQRSFAMTAKYGATSTAAEVIHDVDLHGRSALVTGASSGIGVETARA